MDYCNNEKSIRHLLVRHGVTIPAEIQQMNTGVVVYLCSFFVVVLSQSTLSFKRGDSEWNVCISTINSTHSLFMGYERDNATLYVGLYLAFLDLSGNGEGLLHTLRVPELCADADRPFFIENFSPDNFTLISSCFNNNQTVVVAAKTSLQDACSPFPNGTKNLLNIMHLRTRYIYNEIGFDSFYTDFCVNESFGMLVYSGPNWNGYGRVVFDPTLNTKILIDIGYEVFIPFTETQMYGFSTYMWRKFFYTPYYPPDMGNSLYSDIPCDCTKFITDPYLLQFFPCKISGTF